MKGFPNQVNDLQKLSAGINTIAELLDNGENPGDDGVLGQALVHAGVAGTGHVPRPAAEYIQDQLRKKHSDQSFRTTARGLRELYSLLGFIEQGDGYVVNTDLGREGAAFAGQPLNAQQTDFWRRVITDIEHFGGDAESSHPYQMLLRLVGQRPGISKAKTALALEARNDSALELDRIVQLSDLELVEIRQQLGVSDSNWKNALKVLPTFAEQLGDVIKQDGTYFLAAAPGAAAEAPPVAPVAIPTEAEPPVVPRAPRGSRRVTPDTIGRAGTAETFDDVIIPPAADPEAAAAAIQLRRTRLRRHNLIVQELAGLLQQLGLHEDPFDILGISDELALLIEVKTLDGSVADERDRVRMALAQLLYYEAFVTEPLVGNASIKKIACFESEITEAHRVWLNQSEIGVIWKTEGGFDGDQMALEVMGDYLARL